MHNNWLIYNYRSRGGTGGGGTVGGGGGGGGVTPTGSSLYFTMGAQPYMSDLELPTHWSVCFAKSVMPANTTFVLRNKPPATAEVSEVATFRPISYWPDGSIRWMHVYGNAKWTGGVAHTYRTSWSGEYTAPTSPLIVTDSATGYNINTGSTTFTIPKAYPGIIGQGITGGGPIITDSSGNIYRPTGVNTITVEESGAGRFSVRMEANYGKAGFTPFAKYVTRVTAYQNSSLVNFDHATVFIDDMRNHKVASMGVEFSGNTGQILTRFLAEKAPAAVISGHFWQWPPNLTDTNTAADYAVTNTGSWVGLGSSRHHTIVNTNVYQCQWLKKGPYLDINLPTGYINAFALFDPPSLTNYSSWVLSSGLVDNRATLSDGFTELLLPYAMSGNAVGVANHYEFAINLGASGAALQTVYENRPIGTTTTTGIATSQSLGKISEFRNDAYGNIDQFAINAVKGLFSHYVRYNEGHWATFGALHHEEQIMSNKPQMHRNINNNHYHQGSAIWGIYAASADTGVLRWCRANADYHTSIGQQKVDTSGLLPSPEYTRLFKGAYRHGKQYTPWGQTPNSTSNGVVTAEPYEDLARVSHSCDVGAQLLAWYLDANRWAYEGYKDWASGMLDLSAGGVYNNVTGIMVNQVSDSNFRNTQNGLHSLILAYEDTPTPLISGYINASVQAHLNAAQYDSNFPLFDPLWASKYYEMVPTDTGIAYWMSNIVTGTALIDNSPDSNWAYTNLPTYDAQWGKAGLLDSWTMAVSASYYNINQSSGYLTKFSGLLNKMPQRIVSGSNNPSWEYFGNYAGPVVGEKNFLLQWPRLRYALNQIPTVDTNVPEEGTWLGVYAGRYSSVTDATHKSTHIYTVLNTGTILTPRRTGVNAGDLQDLQITCSGYNAGVSGTIGVLGYADFLRPSIERPSSFIEYASSGYVIPATGLAKIMLTGQEPIVYQNSFTGTCVQMIRDTRNVAGGETTVYRTGVTSGTIAPISGQNIQVIARSIGPNALGRFTIGNTTQWLLPEAPYTGTFSTTQNMAVYVEGGNGVELIFSGVGLSNNPGKLALYGSQSAITTMLPLISGAGYF